METVPLLFARERVLPGGDTFRTAEPDFQPAFPGSGLVFISSA
jgi:hypothetical protein